MDDLGARLSACSIILLSPFLILLPRPILIHPLIHPNVRKRSFSEELSAIRKNKKSRIEKLQMAFLCGFSLARPEGFEPPAFRIGICCDIQLRYGRICGYYSTEQKLKQERIAAPRKIFLRQSTKLKKALAKKRSLAYNI